MTVPKPRMSGKGGVVGIFKISGKIIMFKAKITTAIHYDISFQLLFYPNVPVVYKTPIPVIVVWFLLHQFTARWEIYLNS